MVCCRRPHVLLGVSGSVAAIKVPLIAKLLADFCDVVVIATDASRKLLAVDQLEAMHLPVKGASPFSTSWLCSSAMHPLHVFKQLQAVHLMSKVQPETCVSNASATDCCWSDAILCSALQNTAGSMVNGSEGSSTCQECAICTDRFPTGIQNCQVCLIVCTAAQGMKRSGGSGRWWETQ